MTDNTVPGERSDGQRHVVTLLLTVAAWMAIGSCGGDGPTSPPPPPPPDSVPTTLELTPSAVQLASIGATVQLTATVRDQNGNAMAGQAVSWTSTNLAVASVSSGGLVTALGNGSATVSAAVGSNNSVSANASVTVEQAPASISVDPASLTLTAIGATGQLTATVADSNDNTVYDASVTWTTSHGDVTTVSTSGLVTAVSNGDATITATHSSLSVTATVTVQQVPDSFTLEPTSLAVTVGGTGTLTLAGSDANGNEISAGDLPDVNWSSDNTAVATVSGNKESATVTGVSEGDATVTASAGNVSAGTSVTVNAAPPTSINVNPTSLSLEAIGATGQLTATVTDSNGDTIPDASVTWSTSDESVATVSSSGLVTAVSNGNATITARHESLEASASVTVEQAPASVSVDPASLSLEAIDATGQLTATVTDSNGEAISGAGATWSTSDSDVATVSTSGLVTAVSNGNATIKATHGSLSATATVTVQQVLDSFTLEPTSLTVTVGGAGTLALTGEDSNGNNIQAADLPDVAWSSSDDATAKVSGNKESATVTGVSEGDATVTASAGDVSAGTSVTVNAAPPTSINVNPTSLSLEAIGATGQLTATVTDSNGDTIPDASVTWTTNNDSVATVSSSGLVTAVSNGNTTIKATHGSLSATATVTVQQVLDSFTLEPTSLTVTVGGTGTLTLTGKDSNGNDIQAADLPDVAWSSSDDATAKVSGNKESATVTGVSEGDATVTASAGDVSAGTSVTVNAAPPTSINVNPTSLSLEAIGATGQLTATVTDSSGDTIPDASVTWTTNNDSVATVSSSGLVTAVSNGNTTIKATHGSLSATATVTVQQVLDSFTLEPTSLTVTVGDTGTLTLTGKDSNSNDIQAADLPDVAWSSSDDATAKVSGNKESATVTGVSEGDATVTASAGDVSAGTSVTVNAAPPTSINVNPTSLSLEAIGATGQLTATVTDSSGDTIPDASVTWTTNNDSVATVSTRGLVTAVSNGNTTIKATHGSLSAAATVTVQQALSSLAVDPSSFRFIPDDTQTLTGSWLDANGNPISGADLSAATWSSDDTTIVSVTGTGGSATATAEDWGTATITVTVSDASGIAAAEVAGPTDAHTALMALYMDTDGENWTHNTNWMDLDKDLTDWYGVSDSDGDGAADLLVLNRKNLDGPIPPELVLWDDAIGIYLGGNRLSGTLPSDLSALSELRELQLVANILSGTIPASLYGLDLTLLALSDNDFDGSISSNIGDLDNLSWLDLGGNDFDGGIPDELANLTDLTFLDLARNPDLTGRLPDDIDDLEDLETLYLNGTDLCVPDSDDTRDWLEAIDGYARFCESHGTSIAILSQAVQTSTMDVPLLAGEEALLRVFVTSDNNGDAVDLPAVDALFYDSDGNLLDTLEATSTTTDIPNEIDQSSLDNSVNFFVPGSLIEVGLQIVVEIDPDGNVPDSLGIQKRIPETGEWAIDVRAMPDFPLTIHSFTDEDTPDRDFEERVEGLTADSAVFWEAVNLLPIDTMDYAYGDSLRHSSLNLYDLLLELTAMYESNEWTGYHAGLVANSFGGVAGVAYIDNWTMIARVDDRTIAHEWAHNLGRWHSPCVRNGTIVGVDPDYPHADAEIGAYGYDVRDSTLVANTLADLQAYCAPHWISDYHFRGMALYRDPNLSFEQYLESGAGGDPNVSRRARDMATGRAMPRGAPVRSLAVWGSVLRDSTIRLEPSFVVDAPPSLPESGGPFRLRAVDSQDRTLFDFSFDMLELADWDGAEIGSFFFLLPVDPGWETGLSRIEALSPGRGLRGAVTDVLDSSTDRPMAVLFDNVTGEIRGFIRDWRQGRNRITADDRVLRLAPGLQPMVTRGLPRDWPR